MELTNKLWGLLYPGRCPVCDSVVMPAGNKICYPCRNRLRRIREPYCLKCGQQLTDEELEYCSDCRKKKHVFISGICLYEYESVQEAIYRFKYEGRSEYAAFFGEEMAYWLGERLKSFRADALIPVPIHRKRFRERGYNQAQLLAQEVGKRLRIPVLTNVIERVRNTAPQKGLGMQERQNNLKKAFKMCQNDVKLDTIIIIDDIFTTGATIDAMGRVLLEAGVKEIYFAALAVGKGSS